LLCYSVLDFLFKIFYLIFQWSLTLLDHDKYSIHESFKKYLLFETVVLIWNKVQVLGITTDTWNSKRCKFLNVHQIVTAWWFKWYCKTKPVILLMLRDWRLNHKMFWTQYILRQIKVLSQTQIQLTASIINLLQNLQRLLISQHLSTLVSLILSSL
jgi:hypothetical protein